MALNIGTQAPDFNKRTNTGDRISLGQFKGQKNVLLSFFEGSFTPTAAHGLSSLRQERKRLEELNTQVIGIACDTQFTLNAFALSLGGLPFPLVTDFNPKGEVAKVYDVWRGDPEGGNNAHAVFIVDKEGVIRYARSYEEETLPEVPQLMVELARLP